LLSLETKQAIIT